MSVTELLGGIIAVLILIVWLLAIIADRLRVLERISKQLTRANELLSKISNGERDGGDLW